MNSDISCASVSYAEIYDSRFGEKMEEFMNDLFCCSSSCTI